MRHYVIVEDAQEVLGVWEAPDRTTADRLRLTLSLTYPGCRTHVEQASDFEAFKDAVPNFDLTGLEPEPALAHAS